MEIYDITDDDSYPLSEQEEIIYKQLLNKEICAKPCNLEENKSVDIENIAENKILLQVIKKEKGKRYFEDVLILLENYIFTGLYKIVERPKGRYKFFTGELKGFYLLEYDFPHEDKSIGLITIRVKNKMFLQMPFIQEKK